MSEFVLDETVKVSKDHARALSMPSIELVVIDGPSRGARLAVTGSVARVGCVPHPGAGGEQAPSSGSVRLGLADRAVSRIHCELEVRKDVVTLRDLGSTNGTFVGDVRIREADVPVGTVVRVGASAFRIDAREEPAFVAISDKTSFGELVGGSLEMRRVYAVLERVALTDATLLVEGETGTGKDVVARAVHAASPRSQGPFVPVDCGAIPEALFESELFGHVRGAFTGALSSRAGAFEEASGGTLFLDEIGEMPLALQAKLLRAIETRRIRRVGETKETEVDVRIVCATNRKLARMVNDGTFREDLYYRLAVVEVALPPLRARREDIPALAEHLHAAIVGRRAALAPAFIAQLAARPWPGNIRELRNAIERAVTLGQASGGAGPAAPAAQPSVLPPGIESIVPLHLPLKDARFAWTSEFESIYVRAMLARTNGNLTKAAELAGVSRRFLQRLVARLGVRATDDDGDDVG
jgi:DNA-binding NtrC family response regulator